MTSGEQVDARAMAGSVLGSLRWRCIGPHRGGRVVAVACDVSDPATFYFGACAGGVWKTTDGGVTWRNVSDGFFTTAAVGALAVSTADPKVVYAGTGETTIRGDVSHGDGVYKSIDGGRTWRDMGLKDTRHIGRIVVHPKNPDLVYVAALGHAWGRNQERGVFRSKDGGQTWEHVLYKSDRAGSHDVALDPANPHLLYAAIWQAQRSPHQFWSGGEDSGLWRSTDGGDSWREIGVGGWGLGEDARRSSSPNPQPLTPNPSSSPLGKIGVAVSPAVVPGGEVGRVWALVEAENGALFRSDDGGESWERVNEELKLRTRPWYYLHVTADPTDADTVWVQNYKLWKSIDGGRTFDQIPSPHGDDHALWIDPNHPKRMIEGNDGGACVSFNGGATWSTIYNQPTAQLYHVTADDQVPYRIYASQQDNTALSLPSLSVDGAIDERDWLEPGGGESGYIAVKPDDPNLVVASGPAGRRAYNDIMTLYDRRTGQRWNITVWPELYGWGVGAESLKYRLQWTFPILFSRHDPNALYVAGNHVFRSTDLGASWEVLSHDLTRNDPEKLRPSGGPVTRDNTGAEVYCTIFALAESPRRAGLFWAGTDDGLVHVSEDGGRNWREVTPPDLPEWALISVVEPSPHDAATCYVAATRYKLDDTRPYLFKTNDYGNTWTRIVGGLPEDDFTRVVREDPSRRGLLYAGTETAIYVSFDDGADWSRLGGNLPVAPIHDLMVKGVEMVVATHGRSIWILDDLTPCHQLKDGVGDAAVHLFAPRPTMRIRIYKGFRGPGVPGLVNYGSAGPSHFSVLPVKQSGGSIAARYLDAGENPPNGVEIYYYLEARPADPITLTILDSAGHELRSLTGQADGMPSDPGLNRFLWNRRLPGVPNVEAADLDPWHRPDGPLVLPGAYQVRVSFGATSQTQPFTVEPDPRVRTSIEDLQAQQEFLLQILDRLATVNRTINQIDARLARASGVGEPEPAATQHAALSTRHSPEALRAIRSALIDVHMRQAQLWSSGLHEKLNALFDSVDSADYAPPQQARAVFASLSAQLDGLMERLQLG